jgi:hypothetical protein
MTAMVPAAVDMSWGTFQQHCHLRHSALGFSSLEDHASDHKRNRPGDHQHKPHDPELAAQRRSGELAEAAHHMTDRACGAVSALSQDVLWSALSDEDRERLEDAAGSLAALLDPPASPA